MCIMTQTNPEPQPATLLLIRHGETAANVSGIWQGATDSPLNERGRMQAQAIAEKLAADATEVAAIYSSPLSRAFDTAQIIAGRLGMATVERNPSLAEFNLGEWEGLSYEVLRHEKRLWARMAADPTFSPPGGESAIQFAVRLVTAFKTTAAQHSGQTVILVSHGGAIATALAMLLLGEGNCWSEYQMANCALTELVFAPEAQLVRFNEKAHLHAIGALDEWE